MVRPKTPRGRKARVDIREILANGTVYLPDATARAPSMRDLKSAWGELGPELLANCSPGQRPWAWWAFDPHSPWHPLLRVQGRMAVRGDGPLSSDSQLVMLTKHRLLRPGEGEAAQKLQQDETAARHRAVEALPSIRALRARQAAAETEGDE